MSGLVSDEIWKGVEALAIGLGGHVVETIFKIRHMTIPGMAFDILKDILVAKLKKEALTTLANRYDLDEVRRLHLSARGLSTYRRFNIGF